MFYNNNVNNKRFWRISRIIGFIFFNFSENICIRCQIPGVSRMQFYSVQYKSTFRFDVGALQNIFHSQSIKTFLSLIFATEYKHKKYKKAEKFFYDVPRLWDSNQILVKSLILIKWSDINWVSKFASPQICRLVNQHLSGKYGKT